MLLLSLNATKKCIIAYTAEDFSSVGEFFSTYLAGKFCQAYATINLPNPIFLPSSACTCGH
jgi:hypothetical protein